MLPFKGQMYPFCISDNELIGCIKVNSHALFLYVFSRVYLSSLTFRRGKGDGGRRAGLSITMIVSIAISLDKLPYTYMTSSSAYNATCTCVSGWNSSVTSSLDIFSILTMSCSTLSSLLEWLSLLAVFSAINFCYMQYTSSDPVCTFWIYVCACGRIHFYTLSLCNTLAVLICTSLLVPVSVWIFGCMLMLVCMCVCARARARACVLMCVSLFVNLYVSDHLLLMNCEWNVLLSSVVV